jgi:hypothetical protein
VLILSHMGSSVNQLNFLGLQLGADARISQFQALASVLCSTRTLSHLSLYQYTFDVDSMVVILAALKSNQTLTRLTLEACTMEHDAFDLWTRFLQSGDSLIQELRLTPQISSSTIDMTNALDSRVIGIALLAMVPGSSMQVLELYDDMHGYIPCYAPLFTGLSENETAGRLRRLTIERLDAAIAAALAQFLAQSTCLQELVVDSLFDPDYSWLLLPGIRRNGSVRTFSWNSTKFEQTPPFRTLDVVPNWAWLKLVTAYGKRNEEMTKLLARSHAFTDDVDAADEAEMGNMTPSLVPTLFFVAQQVPRMAGNNILTGLLNVLDSDLIGPPQLLHAMKRNNDSMHVPM